MQGRNVVRRKGAGSRPGSAGFTMVELLVVVTIAAILLAVAVPSYQSTITNLRISTEANALVGDLQYARSEAVKQGLTVQMCISADGNTCDYGATSWSIGHIVVTKPVSPNNAVAATVLRVQRAFSGSDAVAAAGGQSSLAFSRDGFAGTPSTTNWNGFSPLAGVMVLTVHASPDESGVGSCVVVSPIGQISVYARGASYTLPSGAGATCS